ncbi:hypothetical protein CALVIDRAFT_535707 [Calocera viscosa TUFC12733]|uniref:Uncharacterized protein n=1 Tax=Calocera viscosa (strain TUFC12733) TaxID=1330018 RepID=A0A167NVA3_CALVF|nr:hypothetical protein CALVIDRAFT_535707 [Calocera viscosa TUFC12733]
MIGYRTLEQARSHMQSHIFLLSCPQYRSYHPRPPRCTTAELYSPTFVATETCPYGKGTSNGEVASARSPLSSAPMLRSISDKLRNHNPLFEACPSPRHWLRKLRGIGMVRALGYPEYRRPVSECQ